MTGSLVGILHTRGSGSQRHTLAGRSAHFGKLHSEGPCLGCKASIRILRRKPGILPDIASIDLSRD